MTTQPQSGDGAQAMSWLGGSPFPEQAKDDTGPIDQPPAPGPFAVQPQANLEAHPLIGLDGPTPPGEAKKGPTPSSRTPHPADSLLLIYADALDDLERTRIATDNRIRALADIGGHTSPEVARLQALADGLAALEHGAELELRRALRKHPLGPWVKRTIGVGEKQGARLLAAIGDPAWNSKEDRPRRGPAELWAYCGLHVVPSSHPSHGTHSQPAAGDTLGHPGDHDAPDAHIVRVPGVAPSRRRGQRANWSTIAKTRAYLVAESCIKQAASPYRPVYDQGRAKYATATHPAPCARCGPSGRPAQPGSPLSAGHQHARALRLVMKALLRDLWREARDLHQDLHQGDPVE